MKKIKYIFCVELFMFVTICAGCGENKTKSNLVEQTNDSLSICVDEWAKTYLESGPLRKFKMAHPEVKIEIKTVSDDKEEKRKVEASLMSGSGADIYINPMMVTNDFYKAQQAGAFEDLMPLFEKDEGFEQEDYLDGTFDLYENTDACYIFSYNYVPSFKVIYRDIQEKLGINEDNWKKASDYLENVEKFYEEYPSETPFLSLDTFMQDPSLYGMRTWKGSEENKKISALPELRRAMELFKKQAYRDGVDIISEEANSYYTDVDNLFRRDDIRMGIHDAVLSRGEGL